MGSSGAKPTTFFFLFVNLVLYLIITIIASWLVNHGIQDSLEQGPVLSIPARIFPIYYPFGNMATGYVVIFSLLAGVVGFTTSLTGMSHAAQWNASNLYAASASSLITWSLTLLAMGFACKEMDIGWSGSTLRVLETALIIVSGTQLFGMIAIHAGIKELSRYRGGIV
ncbi:membrane protein PM19L-like [Bidens hawaiensis]|uniref:membrane protein PM19L-like n=1 Tax=Bidens hawaiensis TaxID=980011 RepID=UPI00404B6199